MKNSCLPKIILNNMVNFPGLLNPFRVGLWRLLYLTNTRIIGSGEEVVNKISSAGKEKAHHQQASRSPELSGLFRSYRAVSSVRPQCVEARCRCTLKQNHVGVSPQSVEARWRWRREKRLRRNRWSRRVVSPYSAEGHCRRIAGRRRRKKKKRGKEE